MKSLRRPLPVVLLAGLLLVGAFFHATAFVRAGPDTNELTFRIQELTMLRNKFNWFNDRAELQLYVIVTDGVLPLNNDPNAAKWAWPVAGSVPVMVNQTITPGPYFPQVDERAIVGDDLCVYILAIDVDRQSPDARLSSGQVLNLLGSAMVSGAMPVLSLPDGPIGAITALSTGRAAGIGSAELLNWARQIDVVAEDAVVLRRTAGWNVGLPIRYRTADGGAEIVYDVLSEGKPGHCERLPHPDFADLWTRHAGELGCALTDGYKIPTIAEELFEGGHTFWRSDTDEVYIVFDRQKNGVELYGGWWMLHNIPWDGSHPDGVGLNPPSGKVEPKRGFGWVWRNFLGGANGPLGWALDKEYGFDDLALTQDFERGLIFRGSDSKMYVLLDDGQFYSER